MLTGPVHVFILGDYGKAFSTDPPFKGFRYRLRLSGSPPAG